MAQNDKIRLSEEEQDRFVDTLVTRARGEDAVFSVSPSHVDPAQLELLAERASSRTGDPDSVWTVLGDSLADDFERESAVAAAVEQFRRHPEPNSDTTPVSEDGRGERSLNWETVGREVADAVVADLTSGPVDHDRTAIFKTRLQKGGRVSVPEPEIDALGVVPGDLLQVQLRKVEENE